jgi:protein-tyrosine phosphatase
MIDLHCHLLAGLDDGPRDLEESLAMARLAVKGGVHTVVATPHWHPALWPNGRRTILEAVKDLEEALRREGIPLEVRPGCELVLDADLADGLGRGSLLTLNDTGRWVLLELPGEILPQRLEDFFWDLSSRGYGIILAHVERHPAVASDPERLYQWVQMGVRAQITGSSLLGRLGPDVAALCRRLLEHHLVHFLASDGHGVRSRRPVLAAAVRAAGEVLGPDAARRLVEDHPRAVLEGKDVNGPAPVPFKSPRRWWHWFTRRK